METTLALLSLEQAATQAGVHPATIRKLIESGSGPKVTMIGKQFRIRSDHWMAWLDDCADNAPPSSRRDGQPIAAV